ncbi:hypothetical protein C8R45DRAFT_1091177 [Mycena sanguinolenta]|nr:hypothetical protein C8R45DRAFT_1091177 [Mycena sanguinolenta]
MPLLVPSLSSSSLPLSVPPLLTMDEKSPSRVWRQHTPPQLGSPALLGSAAALRLLQIVLLDVSPSPNAFPLGPGPSSHSRPPRCTLLLEPRLRQFRTLHADPSAPHPVLLPLHAVICARQPAAAFTASTGLRTP